LPPIFFLGTISPILVSLAEKEGAGKAAGTIYGISTLGGILMTFAMGFWLMPNLGIKIPMIILGGILLVASLVLLWKANKKSIPRALLIFCFALPWIFRTEAKSFRTKDSILKAEWGMDGEIVVRDEEGPYGTERVALINGMEQSRVRRVDGQLCAQHHYVSMMSRFAALKPSGSRTLLLGLGGGSLLAELDRLGHQVEGCEIDERMIGIAKEYFEAPAQLSNIRNEDARVCINQMSGKFDMVLVDVFWGLQGPSHVLTLQSLEQIHRHLDTKGLMAILFPGSPEDLHARSLGRTMREAGFQVSVARPPGIGSKGMILLGSHLPYAPTYFSPGPGTDCANASGLPPFIPGSPMTIDLEAPLLTDDVPRMEVLMLPLANQMH
jgi:predicted membrane-bound spermidine synthase